MYSTENKKIIILIFITLFILSLYSCKNKEPLTIGFVSPLSGRQSSMGLEEKNGVTLAVEEINSRGGIKGRKISVIYKDDENNPETAKRVVKELIYTGVEVIIGHMTSSMTLTTIDLVQDAKVVMISPTASTTELSGKDDYFFRFDETSDNEAKHLSTYLSNNLQVSKIATVYDKSNEAFSLGWAKVMEESFEAAGGKQAAMLGFSENETDTFPVIVDNLLAVSPEVIVIVAGAYDSALFCQQIRKKNNSVRIILSGWAKTKDFLKHGGAAAEGTIFSDQFVPESHDDVYSQFESSFFDRFGVIPDFPASNSYEIVYFLEQAFNSRKSGESLKDACKKNSRFDGIHGVVQFDEYGDIRRERQIVQVQNGNFSRIETNEEKE